MSSEVETSLDCLNSEKFDSLAPARSASGLPVHVAASPAAPFSTPLRFGRNDKWRFFKTALLLNPVKRECSFRKS
jgi:hypothetical protein